MEVLLPEEVWEGADVTIMVTIMVTDYIHNMDIDTAFPACLLPETEDLVLLRMSVTALSLDLHLLLEECTVIITTITMVIITLEVVRETEISMDRILRFEEEVLPEVTEIPSTMDPIRPLEETETGTEILMVQIT